jgi:hypothetical protein
VHRFRITVFVDSDHAHDLVTRRPKPIRFISKSQKTVGKSNYVSELVVSRIATGLIFMLQ